MFMNLKNGYSEHEYTTQNHLQIEHNPYQSTNSIFQITETNNFTICMETQKTSNSQRNLKEKEWNWSMNVLDFRQYYKVIVIKTVWYWHTYRNVDQWKKLKAQRSIHTPIDNLSLTNEEKVYNGEKTNSEK